MGHQNIPQSRARFCSTKCTKKKIHLHVNSAQNTAVVSLHVAKSYTKVLFNRSMPSLDAFQDIQNLLSTIVNLG